MNDFYDTCHCIRSIEPEATRCCNTECPRHLSEVDRARAHRENVELSWADFTSEECGYASQTDKA